MEILRGNLHYRGIYCVGHSILALEFHIVNLLSRATDFGGGSASLGIYSLSLYYLEPPILDLVSRSSK